MAERGLQPLTVAEALTTADGLLQPGTDVAGVGRYRWGRARRLLPALATAVSRTSCRPTPVPARKAARTAARSGRHDTDEARAAITHTLTGCSPPCCTATPRSWTPPGP